MNNRRIMQRICSTCLAVGTDYYRLEYGAKNALMSICPPLASEVPERSFVCAMCFNSLMILGRFKYTCISHEQKVRSKVIELGRKINLSQLAFPVYFMNGIDIYICRLCSKTITNHLYANLYTLIDGMYLGNICLASLPEVIMDYTYSPVFCEYCTNLMRSLYRFIALCMKTRFKIRSFIEVRNITNVKNIDGRELLFSVRQYSIEVEGHTYSYIYVCGICGFRVREDVDLWNHMVLVHHINPDTLRQIAKVHLQCTICDMFLTENKITFDRHVAQHDSQPTASDSTSNADQAQATDSNQCHYITVDFMGNPIQPSAVPVSTAGKFIATPRSGNFVVSNSTVNLPSHTANLRYSNSTPPLNLNVPSAQLVGTSNSTITSTAIGQASCIIIQPKSSNTNISQRNLNANDTQNTSSNNLSITPSSNLPKQVLNAKRCDVPQASCSSANSMNNQNDITNNKNSALLELLCRPSTSKSNIACSSVGRSHHSDQIAGPSNINTSNSKPSCTVKANRRVVVKRLIYRGNPSQICFSNPNFVDPNSVPLNQTKKTQPNILKRTRCCAPVQNPSSKLRTKSSSQSLAENAAGSRDNTDDNATNNTKPPQNPSPDSDTSNTKA